MVERSGVGGLLEAELTGRAAREQPARDRVAAEGAGLAGLDRRPVEAQQHRPAEQPQLERAAALARAHERAGQCGEPRASTSARAARRPRAENSTTGRDERDALLRLDRAVRACRCQVSQPSIGRTSRRQSAATKRISSSGSTGSRPRRPACGRVDVHERPQRGSRIAWKTASRSGAGFDRPVATGFVAGQTNRPLRVPTRTAAPIERLAYAIEKGDRWQLWTTRHASSSSSPSSAR